MADDEYRKKLDSLQQYIPFLDNMITQLKDPSKKNRQQQLNKMESLHAMITDRKKKLKLETLTKCEDVITKLYEKVNHRPLKPAKSMDSVQLTPASPSPPRDVRPGKPLTIPTERLEDKHKYDIPKIDIYSSAAESLKLSWNYTPQMTLTAKFPDMSKPPISLEDLKTLEDDVHEKINSASLIELNNLRKKIAEELEIENIKEKSPKNQDYSKDGINTIVRSSSSLPKKIVFSTDKNKKTPKESKSITETTAKTNSSESASKSAYNSQKILKGSDGIFGSVLSKIDDHLLEGTKKKDKEERRISLINDNNSTVIKEDEGKTADFKKSDQKQKNSIKFSSSLSGKASFEDKERMLRESIKKSGGNKDEPQQKTSEKHENLNKTHRKDTEAANKSKTELSSGGDDKKDKIILNKDKPSEKPEKVNSKPSVFKRLADKYNPKPRRPTVEAGIDKVVNDTIEAEIIKSPPPKIPPLHPIPAPTPPSDVLMRCADAEPLLPPKAQPETSTQLPSFLQNIVTPTATNIIQSVVNQLIQSNANDKRSGVSSSIPSLLSIPITPMPVPTQTFTSPTDNFVSEYVVEDFLAEQRRISDLAIENARSHVASPPYHNQMNQMHQGGMRYPAPVRGPEVAPMGAQNRFRPPLLGGNRFNDPGAFAPNNPFAGHQVRPERFTNHPGPSLLGPYNAYNQVENVVSPDYYRPSTPGMPLLSPEVSLFQNEQKNHHFGTMPLQGEDPRWRRNQWDNANDYWDQRDYDKNNRDPRTYREYRERREKEHKECRDPRVNRDPRLNKDVGSMEMDRGRSNYRERSQSRDCRSNRYDSKFDKMYSRNGRERSRSRSRSRPIKETFVSPLDSLYTIKDEKKTGKGYGVQPFRIPKKIKEEIKDDDDKEVQDVNNTLEVHNVEDSNDSCEVQPKNKDDDVVVNSDIENKSDNKPLTDVQVEENKERDAICTSVKETLTSQKESDNTAAQVCDKSETLGKEDQKPQTAKDSEDFTKPNAHDQTILAQFFANLLGSRNKRDKKTALYSLISTFSDSFSEKELSKITKIIKTSEDDGSSDEETDNKKTKTVAVKEKEEEPVKKAIESNNAEEKVNKVEAPDTKPIDTLVESDLKEAENSEKSEEIPADTKAPDQVLVSVGERIKNRKRSSNTPAKPKKKCKSELDLLHEDIQDMFIRDGVLTASGKRMCRMLKDDPHALSASEKAASDQNQQPQKIRKKPGPKPKPKPPTAADLKVMKNVRVVISKMPDATVEKKGEESTRTLRRSTKVTNYAEIEDEEEPSKAVNPPEDREASASEESEDETSDADSQKSVNEISKKNKIIKRKRGKGWASGIVPKKRKKKQITEAADEEEETSDVDTFIEPDKNYFFKFGMLKACECKLCDYKGRFITYHYKSTHPESEVLTSRFSPEIAAEAIEDSENNLDRYEALLRIRAPKLHFTCRFCGFSNSNMVPKLFYDHLSSHTGEYRHNCPVCDFSSCTAKSLCAHIRNVHPDSGAQVVRKIHNETILFGYMCGECNYVQMEKKNVEDHVNIFHLDRPIIYKVNMSTTFDPQIESIAEKCAASDINDSTANSIPENDSEDDSVPEENKDTPKAKTTPKTPPENDITPVRKKPGPKPGARRAKMLSLQKQRENNSDTDTTDTSSIASLANKLSENVTKESYEIQDKTKSEVEKSLSVVKTAERLTVNQRKASTEEAKEEVVPMSRSRRAAKDKASEKLKQQLVESCENYTKKKLNTSASLAADTVELKSVQTKPKVTTESVKENTNDESQQTAKANKENKEVNKSPRAKTNIKKEIERNVFECNTDLQEENKKIEQERLQLMDELNKTVGSRSSLNFVDKLCNRLNQHEANIKEEPMEIELECSSPKTMPVLERNAPLVNQPASTPKAFKPNIEIHAKKPVLEAEERLKLTSNFHVTQKNDKMMSGVIQKLQGKLGSWVQAMSDLNPDEDSDSDGPPPLKHVNELVNVVHTDDSTKTILIGGLVKVIKNCGKLTYSCLVPPCVFASDKKDMFMTHCREAHKQQSSSEESLCDLCGAKIAKKDNCNYMESLFHHALSKHSDFLNDIPKKIETKAESANGLKIRRLSGDSLSTSDSKSASDETKENENAQEIVTMADLEMADNPFPFKIAGVMSLAENIPPLTPLKGTSVSQAESPTITITEVKLLPGEIRKPRKRHAAIEKYIKSADLYKCPQFGCMFCSSVKEHLDFHLKNHKFEPGLMIPCIYCDVKTPWEQVSLHLEYRHAHCRYSCNYCLYKAATSEYVVLHQNIEHPTTEYSVNTLRMNHKVSKNFPFIFDLKQKDYMSVCLPFTCSKACNVKFLFENEFQRHLKEVHKNNFIQCGFQHCPNRVQSTKMLSHWSMIHGVSVYQCAYCKTSNKDVTAMYYHFAKDHANLHLDILVRSQPMLTVDKKRDVTYGFTSEAFKNINKLRTFPTSFTSLVPPTNFLGDDKSEPAPAKQPNSPVATFGATQLKVTWISTSANSKPNLVLMPKVLSPSLGSVVPKDKDVPPLASADDPLDNVTSDDSDKDPQNAEPLEPVEEVVLNDNEADQIAQEETETPLTDPLNIDGDPKQGKADGYTSEEESDCNKNEKVKKNKTKQGLVGTDLFRCSSCDDSFTNSNDFKKHVVKSKSCRTDNFRKPYECAHCKRCMKNCYALVEHIQCHGELRVSCSLCTSKFPSANQAKTHMKTRHNVNVVILTPLNPGKADVDSDEYVIKPKPMHDPSSSESGGDPSNDSNETYEKAYTPGQINNIPIGPIFPFSIGCTMCHFSTKVRLNLVRHLEFHNKGVHTVPSSAPVNPVPCLEKKEKMFDKMVNLASSSHNNSRMGGSSGGKETNKEMENLPEFVPTNSRYACCALGCTYLCPDEGNLRHHLMALHGGDTSFTCVHCKVDLQSADAENLLKHFKLHGLQLYKCHYCIFAHNSKHRVEKHCADSHPEAPVQAITVRCLDSEHSLNGSSSQTMPAPASGAKQNKNWRCCMCKYRTATLEGVQNHVLDKHEMEAQYKCAICTYKSDIKSTFLEHFKERHDGRMMDIIHVYRKMEEDKSKDDKETFDTTPIWQRDKPRVKHIRGILFEDEPPAMAKSPKKPGKPQSSSPSSAGVRNLFGQKPGTSRSFLESPEDEEPSKDPFEGIIPFMEASKTNLDLSIESVANGTAQSFKTEAASIGDDFFDIVNKTVKGSETVIEKVLMNDIIVIDDDENLVAKVKDTKEYPVAKEKDNKDSPVAKNRKRKTFETVVATAQVHAVPNKVLRLENEEIIGLKMLSGGLEEDYDETKLRFEFGSAGFPCNRQLKCNKCNHFKSKKVPDFILHLFSELKSNRFKCKICPHESITYRNMYNHIRDHNINQNIEENVVFLPRDPKLELWAQMVIREQSKIILHNFEPLVDYNPGPGNQSIVYCPYCAYTFQGEVDNFNHSVIHWAQLPYGCSGCTFKAATGKEVLNHITNEHSSKNLHLRPTVVVTGPLVSEVIKNFDEKARLDVVVKVEANEDNLNQDPENTADDQTSREFKDYSRLSDLKKDLKMDAKKFGQKFGEGFHSNKNDTVPEDIRMETNNVGKTCGEKQNLKDNDLITSSKDLDNISVLKEVSRMETNDSDKAFNRKQNLNENNLIILPKDSGEVSASKEDFRIETKDLAKNIGDKHQSNESDLVSLSEDSGRVSALNNDCEMETNNFHTIFDNLQNSTENNLHIVSKDSGRVSDLSESSGLETNDMDKVFDDKQDSNESLVIVSKTVVASEMDILCCGYCAHMTQDEPSMQLHIEVAHKDMPERFKTIDGNKINDEYYLEKIGCWNCDFVATEVILRKHHLKEHPMAQYNPWRYRCQVCQKKCITVAGVKNHFLRAHPQEKEKKFTRVSEKISEQTDKGTYRCFLCGYERKISPTAVANLHSHLKQHFRAFSCSSCDLKFRTKHEAVAHVQKKHPTLEVSVDFNEEILADMKRTQTLIVANAKDQKKESEPKAKKLYLNLPQADPLLVETDPLMIDNEFNNEPILINDNIEPFLIENNPILIDNDPILIENDPILLPSDLFSKETDPCFYFLEPIKEKEKNTAKKSTSASTSKMTNEFSFYGCKPEEIDTTKIMTVVEVNGLPLNMSVAQLSRIFNLDAVVELEDCDIAPNLLDLFDSGPS